MRVLRSIPELGSLREQLRVARNDRLGGLGQIGADQRDLVRFSSLFGNVVLVNTPDLAHTVLVRNAKHFEKSAVLRGALYPLAGEGLFTSEGELWRAQRKLMAPLFQPDAIAGYAGAMIDGASRVVDTWSDGATIDMARETTRIAMSVAGKTLFDIDTFEDADALGDALTTVLEWVGTATGSAPMVIQARASVMLGRIADRSPRFETRLRQLSRRAMIPIRFPGARTRALEAALDFLERRVRRMIAERRADPGDRADLLSRLLAARDADSGTAMSDKQVRDEVLTLFVAGHETTANALAWSLMLLCQNPDWHARARAEARAIATPSAADPAALPILTRVFKEALRLYPPVYIFGRVASRETEIDGYAIPKGSVVLVSPFALHRRPDLWPEPERFDPDRFLPEAEAARARTAYLPLGAGPRVCIGSTFALTEGPLVLATVLGRADVALANPRGAEPEPVATIRPKNGLPMRVELRTHGLVQQTDRAS